MLIQPSLLAQAVVSGALLGGVYALAALGLTVIFGVMKIINFAQGSFVMLGMYLAYWMFALAGVDPYLSIGIGIPLFLLFGALVQRFLIQRVMSASAESQLLLTLALSLILQNVALALWKPDFRTVRVAYAAEALELGNVFVSIPRLGAFAVAVVMMLALLVLLQHTDLGRAIRAASQEPEGARLVGISIDRIYMAAFGIGTACAAVAGAVVTPFFHVSPSAGESFAIIAFVVVVLGGMGSAVGALVGGIVIGVAEALGAVLLPGSFKELLIYAVFLGVLLLRPSGLFGRRGT